MILDNRELYSAIESLITQLNEAGEQQWISALIDALSISSVPSEILGETRVQLRKLQVSRIPRRLGIDGPVDEALSYLNQVLGPLTFG